MTSYASGPSDRLTPACLRSSSRTHATITRLIRV